MIGQVDPRLWFVITWVSALLIGGIALFVFSVRPARVKRERGPRTCEPNVIASVHGWSEVLQYSCGDRVCRCGGTGKRPAK